MELQANTVFRSLAGKAQGLFPLGAPELGAMAGAFILGTLASKPLFGIAGGALVGVAMFLLRRADEDRSDYLLVLIRRVIGGPVYSAALRDDERDRPTRKELGTKRGPRPATKMKGTTR